jgi:hypothetical protein
MVDPTFGPPDFGNQLPDSMPPSPWPPPRRRRMRVGRLVLVVAVLAAVIAGEFVDSTPEATASRLAGYTWCCSAKKVSAQWLVPKVLNDTTSSEALWIGVQNGFGAHPELFLQVGILVANVAGLGPAYYAFWSDPAVGFRPQLLQTLFAGELIRTQLVHTKGSWTVRIWSGTSLESRTFDKLASPSGDFAEWFEEDPPFSLYGSRFSVMPDVQAAHFENLKVNGSRPKRSQLTSQGFTAKGVTYNPTKVSSDGFRVLPSSPNH